METPRTRPWNRFAGPALVAAALVATTACGEDSATGPSTAGAPVALSATVPTSGGAGSGSASFSPSFDLQFSDGTASLTITRVAMVLREIELERAQDVCADGAGDATDSNDGCEEFEAGPVIVELPLDGSVTQIVSVAGVPAADYAEIEFEVHKPDDDTAADVAFLDANPEFEDVSIRVEGEHDGSPFVYLTDLNEEQEIDLVPPLAVAPGAGPVNLTLRIDVGTWFRTGDGSLVDPATASDGGANEQLVEDNIRSSIEGFQDDDRDGVEDAGS